MKTEQTEFYEAGPGVKTEQTEFYEAGPGVKTEQTEFYEAKETQNAGRVGWGEG